MKKIYERPVMEIASFESEDIITVSALTVNSVNQTSIDEISIKAENL